MSSSNYGPNAESDFHDSLIPLNTSVYVSAKQVEYRLYTSTGVRFVYVYLHTSEPRIAFYAQDISGISPIVLSLPEIEAYIQDAKRRFDCSSI
jgi:hypothetical protein